MDYLKLIMLGGSVLLKKNLAPCLLLAMLILAMTSTDFAGTGASEAYNDAVVTYQEEPVYLNLDFPINGLYWSRGSYNAVQGYWNNLGEFSKYLPNPINR